MLQGKSNAPRPIQRKKWRKSTIQLVPVTPAPVQGENTELPPVKVETAVENVAAVNKNTDSSENITVGKKTGNSSSSTAETNIPLKLPRAMRSVASSNSNSNSNLLRVRNSEHGEEPVVVQHKESGEPARRSPLRRPKKSEEKENFGV